MAGELNIRSGLVISGSIEQSGGNIGGVRVNVAAASSTHSIDLSQGSNFTVNLSNGNNNHMKCISGSNGQQFHIIVTTPSETATLSSHSNMKYVAENTYVASTSAAKDMLVGWVITAADEPTSYMTYEKNLGG